MPAAMESTDGGMPAATTVGQMPAAVETTDGGMPAAVIVMHVWCGVSKVCLGEYLHLATCCDSVSSQPVCAMVTDDRVPAAKESTDGGMPAATKTIAGGMPAAKELTDGGVPPDE
jgi:hypothetical protein